MTTSTRMNKDRSHMTERILDLTLEIIYLLTGESFPPVKSGDQVTITVPPPYSLRLERHNYEKILEVTQKMMEVLTGKVPIRCQDVSVYLSMEEWEYLEGHKDLYKDLIMEDHQPLPSPDGSSNPPQRCLPLRDSTQEDHPIPHHNRGEEVIDMKIEVREEETNVRPDLLSRREAEMRLAVEKEGSCLSIRTGRRDGWNISEEHHILSPEGTEEDSSMAEHSPRLVNERTQMGKDSFLCLGCGKGFTQKCSLVTHQQDHTNECPTACQNCDICFKVTCCPDQHHDNKASLSCPECGKSFKKRSELQVHQRGHSGKEIFSCPDCEKSFIRKYELVVHQRIHTGEAPFSCPDCKKSFKSKRELVRHQRIHTGEKPFSCSECGKSFIFKWDFKAHHRVHTGEKPFSCSECGKCFSSKGNHDKHMRIHTGEKPFSCSECGRCFTQKVSLIIHQKTHSA